MSKERKAPPLEGNGKDTPAGAAPRLGCADRNVPNRSRAPKRTVPCPGHLLPVETNALRDRDGEKGREGRVISLSERKSGRFTRTRGAGVTPG